MSKKAQIRKTNPEAEDNAYVTDLAEQYDQLHDVKALADSKGGEALVALLVKDVVQSVHKLRTMYKEASHTNLMAECANLNAQLNLAKLVLNAEDNLEHLDEMIQDALKNE